MDKRTSNIPAMPTAIAKQLLSLAKDWGDELALVEICRDGSERSYTRRELFIACERVAYHLDGLGVGEKDSVVVALPNCLEHVAVTIAAWQLGACCVFLAPEGSPSEKQELLSLLDPKVLVSDWDVKADQAAVTHDQLVVWAATKLEQKPTDLPFFAVAPARAIATGGSSGHPKIVVQSVKIEYGANDLKYWTSMTGQQAWERQLVPGSLYHNLYNTSIYFGLFFGQTVYLMDKFNASRALEAIETYKIQSMGLVPTMMERMMNDPTFSSRDLSSIETLYHTGGACSEETKLAWIERLGGGEKVFEFYSMTELVASTVIRGDEWLERRGSVGRPVGCDVDIRDEEGKSLPAGTVGIIYGKRLYGGSASYLGQVKIKQAVDGFCTVNDMGYIDKDGYLYIVDRRSDMIVTGGKNVYTLEVENALHCYPAIKDAVVIGLPDKEWGRRVHAIIVPLESDKVFHFDDLSTYLHERLSGYKIPKTYEIAESIDRTELGKVRRSNLVDERVSNA